MSETKLRVMLHWGGKILHEAGYVRYSIPPMMTQLFLLSLKYERL